MVVIVKKSQSIFDRHQKRLFVSTAERKEIARDPIQKFNNVLRSLGASAGSGAYLDQYDEESCFPSLREAKEM
jgi:hypothetical protein